MRVYYVEIQQPESKNWVAGSKKFTSCKKAHNAARRAKQPARVLMVLEKSNIKLPS